ncbi:hypothetical protein DEO72_LG4g1149 [Vigna unguiculata]|uniref:Uncharacterized protein n=1 Tax=Vigna unguiculata TaxID=3917 RepID=A0A4D6LQC5_VIGUN|nr:hypothetical protein DEO72_LG4g1148 [Vigna unguiculata]QCD90194.1 hypothetical protein DEO72_LG4g1149 [Vigna unguiculata]
MGKSELRTEDDGVVVAASNGGRRRSQSRYGEGEDDNEGEPEAISVEPRWRRVEKPKLTMVAKEEEPCPTQVP